MVQKVALGKVYGAEGGTGKGLWCRRWHWERFMVQKVALGKVYGAEGGTGKGFPPSTFHHCSLIIFKSMLLLYHKNML